MGKKNRKKAERVEKKRSGGWMFLVIAIAVAGIALAVGSKVTNNKTEVKKNSFTVQGGETRPVLDPSQFTGMVRAAYAAARAYPQVLDQVYCYCYCDDPPFNHKSLLSCFVETHGAG